MASLPPIFKTVGTQPFTMVVRKRYELGAILITLGVPQGCILGSLFYGTY